MPSGRNRPKARVRMLTSKPSPPVRLPWPRNLSMTRACPRPMMSISAISQCGLTGGIFVDCCTGPPFSKPAWKEAATASQEACRVASKAMLGMKLIYLFQKINIGRMTQRMAAGSHLASGSHFADRSYCCTAQRRIPSQWTFLLCRPWRLVRGPGAIV
jgi:hypothetical protein